MPLKVVPQKFSAAIKEVTIGTGTGAVTFGGENVLPLYSFDAPITHPPAVGIEVLDDGDAAAVAARAKQACAVKGAAFVSLVLESADPNGDDRSIADCVAIAKAVSDAATLPLVIHGCKNIEKDAKLFEALAKELEGKNVLLLSAREENYKAVAAAGVLAYNQKIPAESAVDINLAKQLNVLIGQLGVKNESLAMNVGSAAAGYGFEYVVSTMERIKLAALSQDDAALQVPIITPIAGEVWSVKESSAPLEDAPSPDWGSPEERGINMEVSTAVAAIAAGSGAVILRHPKSVEAVAKFVSEIV